MFQHWTSIHTTLSGPFIVLKNTGTNWAYRLQDTFHYYLLFTMFYEFDAVSVSMPSYSRTHNSIE
jgi:hypothetical protein